MKVRPSVELEPDVDDVALFDVVALVQNNRDAVTRGGRGAGKLGDVADNLADARAAVRLGVLNVACQRVDDIAGKMGAIG